MPNLKTIILLLALMCLQFLPVALVAQEKERSFSANVDIPEGIQNIGADMIKLVDQIIFGERDPTQRLSLEPLLDDINKAIEASPLT